MSIHTQLLSTPAGDLLLGEYQNRLCLCDWVARRNRAAFDTRLSKRINADFIAHRSSVLTQAIEELKQYFAGERQHFEVPMITFGTEFQRLVWQALHGITYGETTHYQQLAQRIDKPTAVRAVANAIGANPISIIIPCHRVLGKNQRLTGYAGGIGAKRILLNLEYHHTLTSPIYQD